VKSGCRLGLFLFLAAAALPAQMTKHIGYSTFAGLEPMVAVSLDQPVQTYQQAEAQNYLASSRFADAPAGAPNVSNVTAIPPAAPSPLIRDETPPPPPKFKWKPAIEQSLLFLGLQHSWRFTQSKTRRNLGGDFFDAWGDSVRNVGRGWGDGDNVVTNYFGHPMEGATAGFIQIQNDPNGAKQQIGMNGDYWRSRLKAMAWAAAYSTQFEIGPISEATIGHVGRDRRTQGMVDLVTTPTAGLGFILGEDLVDRHIIQPWERTHTNPILGAMMRSLLNPDRSLANLTRLKAPWRRDDRDGPLGEVMGQDLRRDEPRDPEKRAAIKGD
jgi:hypothetical protein